MKLFSILLSSTLIVFLLLLVFLSYISPFKSSRTQSTSQEIPKSSLYFTPSVSTNSCGTKQTADILIDTHGNTISTIQIELSYDPNLLSDLSISPSQDNFLGEKNSYNVNLLDVRPEYGRASLSLEKLQGHTGNTGVGKVATISFIPILTASPSAKITFLNKTNALGENNRESLLVETSELIVNCQSPTAVPFKR